MKNLFILMAVLFMSSITYGQCTSIINNSKNGGGSYKYHDNPYGHWYVSGAFDVNNAFNFTDSTVEPKGLDFDVEVGVRSRSMAYYGFYGEYDEINYRNYGAGVDYFVFERGNLDVLLGVNVGGIDITSPISGRRVTYFAYAGRVKTIYNINNSIGIFAVGQYQQRYDRADVEGIVEGMIGIQFYIN